MSYLNSVIFVAWATKKAVLRITAAGQFFAGKAKLMGAAGVIANIPASASPRDLRERRKRRVGMHRNILIFGLEKAVDPVTGPPPNCEAE